jgi:pimeloyl-ACP methyl ester carboxylesterase
VSLPVELCDRVPVSDAVEIVLVPGAWHGAWCWERVVAGLAARGVRAMAVDLPGRRVGEATSDLYRDAAHVQSLLDGMTEPVVLVGHSAGGAVITEAGEHPAVTHLVYVAAFAVDVGEGCGDAAANDPDVALISHEGRPDLGAAFVLDDSGNVSLDPQLAAECLYNDCDPATVQWALERVQRQPLAALQQPATRAAWRSRPSTYAVCAADQAVHPDLQRLLAKRCTNSVEWDTGHSPFLSRPDLLVDLFAALAVGSS